MSSVWVLFGALSHRLRLRAWAGVILRQLLMTRALASINILLHTSQSTMNTGHLRADRSVCALAIAEPQRWPSVGVLLPRRRLGELSRQGCLGAYSNRQKVSANGANAPSLALLR